MEICGEFISRVSLAECIDSASAAHGALRALDCFILREQSNSGKAIDRVPNEIWMLIKECVTLICSPRYRRRRRYFELTRHCLERLRCESATADSLSGRRRHGSGIVVCPNCQDDLSERTTSILESREAGVSLMKSITVYFNLFKTFAHSCSQHFLAGYSLRLLNVDLEIELAVKRRDAPQAILYPILTVITGINLELTARAQNVQHLNACRIIYGPDSKTIYLKGASVETQVLASHIRLLEENNPTCRVIQRGFCGPAIPAYPPRLLRYYW